MFTLENRKTDNRQKKSMLVYLSVSAFCLLFFIIYSRFSHGVYSLYMTCLFVWPLVLGFLPALGLFLFPKDYDRDRLGYNIYHTGVASVTVSSMLRGILEIAGTSSIYQRILMYIGAILLLVGVVLSLLRSKKKNERTI